MDLTHLLTELAQQNVQLWVDDDDQLRMRAPKGRVTTEIVHQIKHQKIDLIALLKERRDRTNSLKPLSQSAAQRTTFPLSYNQQSLWFLHQHSPESTAYHSAVTLRIPTAINADAFEATVRTLIERHAALRTTFAMRDGELFQEVHPLSEFDFAKIYAHIDATACAWDDLTAMMRTAYQQPFDLEKDAGLRIFFYEYKSQEQILLVIYQHLVCDGWSLWLMLEELQLLYAAQRNGQSISLSAQPYAYADFVDWQQHLVDGVEGEHLWRYWQQQLAGELPTLNLPTDRPRPPIQTFNGLTHEFALEPSLLPRLRELAQHHTTTLYTVLAAAWQVLLYRFTGQEDILLGTPTAGRTEQAFTGIVGHFVNPVVLRGNLSADPSFVQFLVQMRQTVLGALEHQHFPFSLLVQRLQPARDASRSPLFQVSFTYQQPEQALGKATDSALDDANGSAQTMSPDDDKRQLSPGQSLGQQDAPWQPFVLLHQAGTFDLVLEIAEGPDSLAAVLKYNADLFVPATIRRMAHHFAILLASIVENPTEAVSRLSLLTADDRQHLIMGWNQSGATVPHERCMHEIFEAQVTRTPDAVAAIFEDEQVTYLGLNQRANYLAHILIEQGIAPEKIVGVLARRNIDFLTAILAIFKAGGVYLPLDPLHPPDRLQQILTQSRADVVLVASEFEPLLAEALPVATELQTLALAETLATVSMHDARIVNLPRRCTPDHLAYVIFTSGSTGMPKGAMVEQKGMLNHLYAKLLDLDLTAADSVAQNAPQSFDISVWQFLAALIVGGRVHIFSDEVARDPWRLLEQVANHAVTILEVVPSLMRMMVETTVHHDLSHLRWLMPTGEALPPMLCRQWLERYPHVPVINAYGPTECSDDVTHYPIFQPPPPHVVNMPIGRPVANMRIYILDRHLCPVPTGVVGELYVGGIGVGRGYLHDDVRTAQAFVADPFHREPGARLYKTGDLGRYLADGNIEFLGRIDFQVKVRGFRIELGEIETALARHPTLRESVVVACTDVRGLQQLVAYVVPSQTAGATEGQPQLALDELRSYLKVKLPDYMIPAAFVELPALPLTVSGKIDRRALPAPTTAQLTVEQPMIKPRTPVEQLLAAQWQQILGLEQISTQDNFFEIGGDSIRVAVLVNGLQELLGEILHIAVLFAAPTIAELAAYLEEHYAPALANVLGEPVHHVTPHKPARLDAHAVAYFRHLLPTVAPALDNTAIKNPRAIFILSPPRSGSTLLRVMLGGHPQLFAPPELDLLGFTTLAERTAAQAGRERYRREGLIRAFMQANGCTVQEAEALLHQMETAGATTGETYQQLQAWIAGQTLVDKTPAYTFDPNILARMEAIFEEPLYIHLVRHPHAALHSFDDARLDQIYFQFEHQFTRHQLAELSWLIGQQNITNFLAQIPHERHCQIKFEELVTTPQTVLQQLCTFLSLEFHPAMLEPYDNNAQRMTDGLHTTSRMLGDVKFHSYDTINPDVALRWQGRDDLIALSDETQRVAFALGYGNGVQGTIDPTPPFETHVNLLGDDLQGEVTLDPLIRPSSPMKTPALMGAPMSILLTGATGFLGAYLLRELLTQTDATIYCLMRAQNEQHGAARLRENLETYSLWQESFSERLVPVLGDLAQAQFGLTDTQFLYLADQIDSIYHNGAWVNFVYPYAALKPSNVLGTQEVLRLACQGRTKPVHLISTLSIFRADGFQRAIAYESDPLDFSHGFENGYAASKWVAEQLALEAQQRGLPVTIYRPGRITGDSRLGMNNLTDLFSSMLKGCIQLGQMPKLEQAIDLVPVDYVSRAIVALSTQSTTSNQIFHLANPTPIPATKLVGWLQRQGYLLEEIDYERWRTQSLAQVWQDTQHPLYPFLPLFRADLLQHRRAIAIDCRNTVAALTDLNIVCPPADGKLLATYLDYFIRSGYLQAPEGG